jgi:hypothetical protein
VKARECSTVVVLDRVVLLGPALAGVVGRVVRPAGQDRAGLEVDQDALKTGRLQRVVVAAALLQSPLAGACCRAASDDDLVHLTDLLLQRHAVKQVVDSILDRGVPVEVARLARRRARPRSRPG